MDRNTKLTLSQQIMAKKGVSTLYIILRILVIISLIMQIANRNFENAFLCLLTLVLFLIPTLVERAINIDLPNTLEIIILLFIFSAEILGEINQFYALIPFWDVILHTINGFLAAAIGFALVDLFNRHEHFTFHLSPLFLAIVAFCFSMTIGVLWEFFEFSMDSVFLLDMQKDSVVSTVSSVMLVPENGGIPTAIRNITDVILIADGQEIPLGVGGYLDIGIIDTMEDLFVNFIGAIAFSFIGYFYVKNRGKGKFARQFIPQVLEDESEAHSGQNFERNE